MADLWFLMLDKSEASNGAETDFTPAGYLLLMVIVSLRI
jgi:hypothetical protein